MTQKTVTFDLSTIQIIKAHPTTTKFSDRVLDDNFAAKRLKDEAKFRKLRGIDRQTLRRV